MKRAVSVSLGSSRRDKKVEITLKGVKVSIERIGTDGDVKKAKRIFSELDGHVDAFGVGGVDLYIRLDERVYPLRAALEMVKDVKHTPLCDGRGLKHTLERRVFQLVKQELGELPHFQKGFVPVAVDRLGLAEAVDEVAESIVIGDLMVALGIPIPLKSIKSYKRIARILLPVVSFFPMSMLFYGSGGSEQKPKYTKYFNESDLLAGDFLFMRKYMPTHLLGKTIVTNTTTDDNIELLRQRGVKMVITTTPRYDGRSFGTNMLEAALTAFAGKNENLTDNELSKMIDELELRPTIIRF